MTISPGGRPADASPVGTPGGRQNWVDKVGGLPSYIRMVAHALIRKGQPKDRAIATAVNMMRKWAAGADNVRPQVQAAAAKALAEWEAKKGAAHSLATPVRVDAAELLDLAIPEAVLEWAVEAYDHDLPLDLARDYVRDQEGKFAPDVTDLARAWLKAQGVELTDDAAERFEGEVVSLAAEAGAEVLDLAPGDYQPPYDWKHGYIPITPAAALSKAGKGPHAGKGRARTPKGAKLPRVSNTGRKAKADGAAKATPTSAERTRAQQAARRAGVLNPDVVERAAQKLADRRAAGESSARVNMGGHDVILNTDVPARARATDPQPTPDGRSISLTTQQRDRMGGDVPTARPAGVPRGSDTHVSRMTGSELRREAVARGLIGEERSTQKSDAELRTMLRADNKTPGASHEDNARRRATGSTGRVTDAQREAMLDRAVRGGQNRSDAARVLDKTLREAGEGTLEARLKYEGFITDAGIPKAPDPRARTTPPETPSTSSTNPDAPIRIEHGPDGTLVHGTSREDAEAIKAVGGFKWSRNLGAWYLPRTWGEATRERRVRQLEAKLGDKAGVDRATGPRRSAAERDAEKRERAANRAERMDSRAEKRSAEAERRFEASDLREEKSGIPFGQPILVGHHSEKKHRRTLERAHQNLGKGVEAQRDAERAQEAAERARRTAAGAESKTTTGNRIKKLEAEQRDIQRKLDGTSSALSGPASGAYAERLRNRAAEVADELEFNRGKLAAAGGVPSKETVSPGDFVKVRGQWYPVRKANAKSVTLPHWTGGTGTSPYHEVSEHRKAADVSREDVARMVAGTSKAFPGLAAELAKAAPPKETTPDPRARIGADKPGDQGTTSMSGKSRPKNQPTADEVERQRERNALADERLLRGLTDEVLDRNIARYEKTDVGRRSKTLADLKAEKARRADGPAQDDSSRGTLASDRPGTLEGSGGGRSTKADLTRASIGGEVSPEAYERLKADGFVGPSGIVTPEGKRAGIASKRVTKAGAERRAASQRALEAGPAPVKIDRKLTPDAARDLSDAELDRLAAKVGTSADDQAVIRGEKARRADKAKALNDNVRAQRERREAAEARGREANLKRQKDYEDRLARARGTSSPPSELQAEQTSRTPGGITEGTARRMSDEQLDRAMRRLMADGTYTGPAFAVLEREMDRRDKARAEGNGRRR